MIFVPCDIAELFMKLCVYSLEFLSNCSYTEHNTTSLYINPHCYPATDKVPQEVGTLVILRAGIESNSKDKGEN
jgi:hypothetical protein